MAKKVVATLKKGDSVKFTKAIKMVRSLKTGSYVFVEKIVVSDRVDDFLKNN